MSVLQQKKGTKPSPESNRRVFGLDLLRAIAVLLVLASHTLSHGTPPDWLKWYLWPQGKIGVEIFYVLSGFLIGSILIRSSNSGRLESFADILDFWKRRWARTLPLYIFFLIVYFRFDYHGPGDLKKYWTFFFFLQNLAWPMPPFFEHSWSLTVEEWFYLLAPLVFVFAASRLQSKRAAAIATCIFFVAVPALLRTGFGIHAQTAIEVEQYVRSIVICRLDSLFFGVVLAYVRIQHPAIFTRMVGSWHIPLTLLLCATLYISLGSPWMVDSLFIKVVFYPALSILIATIIPRAMSIRSLGHEALDRFVTWTSTISYSLYLGHICMLTLVLGILPEIGWRFEGLPSTLAIYALLFCAYYIFAQLTYALVEQPYIKLRDRVMGHSDERSGAIAIGAATAQNTTVEGANRDAVPVR